MSTSGYVTALTVVQPCSDAVSGITTRIKLLRIFETVETLFKAGSVLLGPDGVHATARN